MRINNKILDLVTIYNNHKLGDLLDLYELFKETKFDLEVCIALLKEDYEFNPSLNPLRDKEYAEVSTQLYYVKENLIIIEKAILCHEDDVFETYRIKGEIFSIGLN